ncbi:hypothetical protein BC830DRAFT_49012 [Chytriomyces sp. MP71]|nr:hypothetical protein BC830DRAFT_49012 [Chytriomyces sp. MP71]
MDFSWSQLLTILSKDPNKRSPMPPKGAAKKTGKPGGKDASHAEDTTAEDAALRPPTAKDEPVVPQETPKPMRIVDRSFISEPIAFDVFKRHEELLRGATGHSQPDLMPAVALERPPPKRHNSGQLSETVMPEELQIQKPRKKDGLGNRVMCDEMAAALALRERRILRRRNRALGVPLDPNDSDDSLLAEIKEATDEKLFPGFLFEGEGADVGKVIESRKPIRLNVAAIKRQLQSHVDQVHSNSLEATSPSIDPTEVLESLTPTTKQMFESLVYEKYHQNGVITGFKGKNEMKSTKLKTLAKNEIAAMKVAAAEKELELIDVKHHIDNCRVHAKQYTLECETIINQIQQMEQSEKPLHLEPHLAHPKLGLKWSQGMDPLNYTFPQAPHLLQNRRFRHLCKSYMDCAAIAQEAIAAVPLLEAETVPIGHELKVLQTELAKLRRLDEEILESDLIHAMENIVVRRLMAREEKRRHQRVYQQQQEKEAERKEKMAARKKVAVIPKKGVKPVRKLLQSDAEGPQARDLIARNMNALDARVAKILRSIAERVQVLNDHKSHDDLGLSDGEMDLSETLGVRETRKEIASRQLQSNADRNDHAIQKCERELQKALEHLAPRPFTPMVRKTRLDEFKLADISTTDKRAVELTTLSEMKPKPPRPNHKIEIVEKLETDMVLSVPFMAEPHNVNFIDYEPQRTYSQTVKITNVSCRVNTFRLLPIPVELATFFDVLAPPPGRMSAGMVCEVTFIFRPPTGYNQDIVNGLIQFEAEHGGVFSLNLGCSAKKCRPFIASVGGPNLVSVKLHQLGEQTSDRNEQPICDAVSESHVIVNFGNCVQGGVSTRYVEIRNNGAVATVGEISKMGEIEACTPFFLDKKASKDLSVLGYSSNFIKITFEPPRSNHTGNDRIMTAQHIIKFNTAGVSDIKLDCVGTVLPAPLRLDLDVVDFGICVTEVAYRECVVITNYSNTAIKYWIDVDGMSDKRKMMTPFSKSTSKQRATADTTEFGSMICTDGIDSDEEKSFDDNDSTFFSNENLIMESEENMNQESLHEPSAQLPSKNTGSSSRNFLQVGGLNSGGKPRSPSRSSSCMGLDELIPTQFSIRRIKKASRSATSTKRADNLDLDVQNMGELEISPRLAIIQPFETSKVYFKVKPSRSGHFLLKNGENPYVIQVFIRYMNQGVDTPIPLKITGRVTTTDISFSIIGKNSTEFCFGECSLLEAKELALKISNSSRLPQKLRFNASDASIKVLYKEGEDIHGAVPVPPRSDQIRVIRFEPSELGTIKARLSCHSVWNRNFELKCTGSGKKLLVHFDNSELRLKNLALGSTREIVAKLIYDKQQKADFSTANFSNVASIVKNIWTKGHDSELRQSRVTMSRRKKTDEDVEFEFGTPKIIGIFQLSKLEQDYRFEEKNKFFLQQQSVEISRESEKAVSRTDASLLKSFRPVVGVAVEIPEFSIKTCKPSEIFTSGESVARNPRIVVPSNVDVELDSGSLVASFHLNDPVPVTIKPKHGVLTPGEEIDISVTLHPADITKLAAYHTIKAKLEKNALDKVQSTANLPLEASKQITILEKAPDKPVKGKDAKENKEAKDEDPLQPPPPEPIVYSVYETQRDAFAHDPINHAEELEIAKIYQQVDATCLSILVPCKIRKTMPARIVKQQQAVRKLEAELSIPEIKVPHKMAVEKIYLKVIVPLVAPDLLLLEPSAGVLNFDTVPVGQEKRLEFTICNISNDEVQLGSYGIRGVVESPFHVISDMNLKLAPQAKHTILVLFRPKDELTFSHKIEVNSEIGQVSLKLIGQGYVPNVRLEPSEREMFIGDVALGDIAIKTFHIYNDGFAAVDCGMGLSEKLRAAQLKHEYGTINFNQMNAFSVSPWSAEIAPFSSQEFTVKFAPDRESDRYYDCLRVQVWGAMQPLNIFIHARCWDTSSALLGYDRPDPRLPQLNFALPPAIEVEHARRLWNGEFSRPVFVPPDELDDEASATYTKSTLSIGSVTDAKGSTTKLAAIDAKKKGSVTGSNSAATGKEKDKSDAMQGMLEETMAEMLKLVNRVDARYVTLTAEWKQQALSGKWYVDTKEIYVAGMKPANFTKPETKRPPFTEYLVEAWPGAFRFSPEAGDITVEATKKTSISEPVAKFTIDSMKGVVELGSMKAIQVKLVNPGLDFQQSVMNLKKQLKAGLSHATATLTDEIKEMALFEAPLHIETYFKVTLKGGYRFVDPKGLVAQAESRVWILKVMTVPFLQNHT